MSLGLAYNSYSFYLRSLSPNIFFLILRQVSLYHSGLSRTLKRLALNSESICLCLLGAGITSEHHHTWYKFSEMYFYFRYECVVCIYAHHVLACLDLKRVPSPLGLELEMVVNLYLSPEN